jgi:predicted ribosomally synthesized peptide with nif11-like leader
MSLESAQAYYLRLATDDTFLQLVNAAETIEERLQIAETSGYQCSLEELNQALTTLVNSQTLEEAFGLESGEVLAYAALSLLAVQNRTAVPYGPPYFWTQPFQRMTGPMNFRG